MTVNSTSYETSETETRCSGKLRSLLLGTHFVHLQNTADEIVRPIKYTASNERYCVYFGSHLIFIDRANCGWMVTPLTLVWPPLEAARRS